MPSDVVTIVVSAGIGVSVVAGVLSGVCYVLAHGFTSTSKRHREASLQWNCVVCGRYLRSSVESNIKVVICTQCEERVCKKQCSKRNFSRREWICYSCLKRPSFITVFFNTLQSSIKKIYSVDTSNEKEIMTTNLRHSEINSKVEQDYIRDFIEKIVSTIVGDSVDDASITRIFSDKQYNAFFAKYHQPLSTAIASLSTTLQMSMNNSSCLQTDPSTAHSNLKHLIERILREASHIPPFRKFIFNPSKSEEQTYEELLATAILNKIISKPENYTTWSSESSASNSKHNENNSAVHETHEAKWKDFESTSSSSLEEYLYSDSSYASSKYVDNVTLTIRQQIEEIPSHENGDFLNDLHHSQNSNSANTVINDQANWHLQKRPFSGTNSPVPVPMVVPNPSISAKVLIGDKEIDETSDLSDAGTDYDREVIDGQSLLIDSISCSRNKLLKNYKSDEETSFDSGVRDDKYDYVDRNKFYSDDEKDVYFLNGEDGIAPSILSSLNSTVEKDSEYTEKISSLPTMMYSDSATNSMFGRDYYTKQASLPSGSGKFDEINHIFNPEEEITLHRAELVSTTINDFDEVDNDNVNNNYVVDKTYDFQSDQDLITNNVNLEFINKTHFKIEQSDKILTKNVTEPFSLRTSTDIKQERCVTSKIFPAENVHDEEITTDNKNLKSTSTSQDLVEPASPPKTDTSIIISQATKNNVPQKVDQYFEQETILNNYQITPKNVLQKSDNTLIKKIYSNPVVRNFALTNRERIPYNLKDLKDETKLQKNVPKDLVQIPDPLENKFIKPQNKISKNCGKVLYTLEEDTQKNTSKDNLMINKNSSVKDNNTSNTSHNLILTKVESDYNNTKDVFDTFKNFSLEFSDNESSKEESSPQIENDFHELREKRLVASRLVEISKSYPNLTRKTSFKQKNKTPVDIVDTQTDKYRENIISQENFISVKDLKKLFEKKNNLNYNKNKPVHSLTARSISKTVKEKLDEYNQVQFDNDPNEK